MKTRVGLLLASIIAALSLTACGSGSNQYQQPGTWGPTYGGQTYCGYITSPLECTGHPGIPMLMPTVAPAGYYPGMTAATDLATLLFIQRLTYAPFYASPGYYNRYVPQGYRSAYITTYVRPFDTRYAAEEKTAQPRATYKDANGKVVPPGKVDPKKFTPPKNNGGSGAKTKNCGEGPPLSVVFSRSGGGSHGSGSHGGSSRSGNSGNSGKGGNRSGNTSKKGGC